MIAHVLTGVRLLAAAPFAWSMALAGSEAASFSMALLGLAIGTDLLDGPVSRRRGTASPAGRVFDHTSDFVFVLAGLVAGSARGAFPWALPVSVALAFSQYAADSYVWHREGQLRMSVLGRWNGIFYFLPLGLDSAARLGAPGLREAATLVAWTLVLTTCVSIADRALSLRASRPRTG